MKNNKYFKIIIICLSFLITLSLVGCSNKCKNDSHNSEWITVLEPTCNTLGSKELTCKKCGEVLTSATINYLEHDIVVDKKVEATCEENGLSEGSHCGNCGLIIDEQVIIDSIGHNYVLDVSSSTPTLLVYNCVNCDKKLEKETDGSCENHISSEWIVKEEATCEKKGLKNKVCTNCLVELEIQEIPSLKHNEIKIEGKEATCTEKGLTDGIKCESCNKVIQNQTEIEALGHSYIISNTLAPTEDTKGYIEYTCTVCNDSYKTEIDNIGNYNPNETTVVILSDKNITVSNNNGGVIINDNNVVINLSGEYDFVGTLTEGSITVSLQENDKAIINLKGVNITSSLKDPIFIESGDKVEISAKSGTINNIYDKRTVDGDVVGGGIYSKVDLEIKGKGELNIESTYNNGIASTKDLEIKNLTLNINVPNNAIKGNDSITIESGTIKAISSSGDALKTENSDISDKGNQRGNITINGGTLELYAACDGIDTSYDVIINGGNIKIYTESYSEYSGEVTVTQSEILYLRVSSRSGLQGGYQYSVKFLDDNNNITWVNAVAQTGQSRYFEIKKPTEAKYMEVYCYSLSQTQGQDSSYSYKSDLMTIPTSFDEYYITSKNTSSKTLIADWSNHSTNQTGPGGIGGWPGRPGGDPGGMGEGNSNKADYSCKGIKADNVILITNGDIYVKSHDDAIHTNSDVLLETGIYGKANIDITGGTLKLYSDDDALHADGDLNINGGNIIIENSYEGVEGNNIYFNNGTVQIKSLDDGINAKNALVFSGSTVYLDAGGDGIDSNNTVSMTDGIVLAQGPSNGGNGVLDYDRSFTFSGGLLLAIGCNGMNQRPSAASGNTSTSKSISTNTNSYVTVTCNNEIIAVIKVTKNSQNHCVLAYNNSSYPNASVNVTTSNSKELVNGLYYAK